MNYELAKELRDAGFPQNSLTCGCDGPIRCSAHIIHPALYEPTLSELIEACGRHWAGFEALLCFHSQVGDKWGATSFHKKISSPTCDTPEEAVARLWLALNRKEA